MCWCISNIKINILNTIIVAYIYANFRTYLVEYLNIQLVDWPNYSIAISGDISNFAVLFHGSYRG
jgi:hypothetical protein